MKFAFGAAALAVGLGFGVMSPASAQSKPAIAIMPTQYFSATAESAENITKGLAEQWEAQGYSVMDQSKSNSTFQTLGLGSSQHYADSVALKFGRSLGSDLVAYPRLLAVGTPLANVAAGSFMEPETVLHLRVLNVKTGAPIYFRQIGHEFRTDSGMTMSAFVLPQPVATATAQEITGQYFQRVAGSRQEFGRKR